MKNIRILITLSLASILLGNTGCSTRTITEKKGMSGISSTANNTAIKKADEKKSKKRSFKMPFAD